MNKSINETLSVIRQALNEEQNSGNGKDVLILNQLVNDDGTITTININNFSKHEIKNVLDKKIDKIFDQHLDEWLNKNMPKLLEKYFSKKNNK